MSQVFLQRLQSGTLLSDGAMGTEIYTRGYHYEQSLEHLNLSHAHVIKAIHRSYLDAGADLIEANTFGANPIHQDEFGLANLAVNMAKAGVSLALEARNESTRIDAIVAASIGPLGKYLLPYGTISQQIATQAYSELLAALTEAGAECLIFETFSDLDELLLAIRTARSVCSLPIVAHMTFGEDGHTALGHTAEGVATVLAREGVEVAGANCSVGPSVVLDVVQRMHQVQPDLPLSALANAGFPTRRSGRLFYPSTPEYFASYVKLFQSAGVSVIGGCCGTTPDHIRAMRAYLDQAAPPSKAVSITIESRPPPQVSTTVDRQPTGLAQALRSEFVCTVEMSPPRGYDPSPMLERARLLRDAGVTAINVADSPRARMRMSPWAAAMLVQTRLQMDTILHFPTRGRNLLRVQGDLLAAHALNIRNLFIVMGDPTRIGDFPDAHDNFDVPPSGLVRMIKQNLNQGVDQAGQSIGQPTQFFVGAAVNLGAPDLEREITILNRKLEGGADFLLSQPVFDLDLLDRFYAAWGGALPVPLLVGLLPLVSSRHANFLHFEVPGIEIPDGIRDLIAQSDNPEGEGIALARHLLAEIRMRAQGVYMMPPFGRYHLVPEIYRLS